jgi:hypothetical protein
MAKRVLDDALELIGDRGLAVVVALGVVTPHANESVGRVEEVSDADGHDLGAAQAASNAEHERPPLLAGLGFAEKVADVVFGKPDLFSVALVVVLEAHAYLTIRAMNH